MKRNIIGFVPVIVAGVCAFGCANQQQKKEEAQKPNILFIMSDDHAAHAISAYGSRINTTPNIDRLAAEGAVFNNCFCTNSICSPSRAVILTGKYSHINGVLDNRQTFNGLQDTYPKYLKSAGYETAIVGKWHLKSEPTGFDYWNILPGQGSYNDPEMIENGTTHKYQGYVTDIITEKALQWLENRENDKPFCLMVHHKAVHANWETDNKHADMYSGMKIPEPATFNDNYASRTAQIGEHKLFVGSFQWQLHYQYRFGEMPVTGEKQEKREWMYQRYIKDYLTCVASLDDNIGRILNYLDRAGLSETTIVIYTSDQGFFLGDHGLYDKRFMYEHSIRMPLFVRYPKEIKPATVIDNMVLNLDFAETLLDYAGIETPQPMQGSSFRQLAQGRNVDEWRKSMYYRFYEDAYGIGPHEGIRTHKFKLIHFLYGDEGWELYDLENDPDELNNLYYQGNYAGIKESLERDMQKLKGKYRVED